MTRGWGAGSYRPLGRIAGLPTRAPIASDVMRIPGPYSFDREGEPNLKVGFGISISTRGGTYEAFAEAHILVAYVLPARRRPIRPVALPAQLVDHGLETRPGMEVLGDNYRGQDQELSDPIAFE